MKNKDFRSKKSDNSAYNIHDDEESKVICDKRAEKGEEDSETQENGAPAGKSRIVTIISAIVLALILIFKPELLQSAINEISKANYDGVYAVFIDVGQGDSIFLKSPNGKTMLIDAGTSDSFSSIKSVLDNEGVTKLDVVIMTHPHSDHMGSMNEIAENYKIGTFYMPDAVNTTSMYDKLLSTLERKNIKTKTIWGSSKSTIKWDDDVEVRVLSPIEGEDYLDNLNDLSIVVKVTYGDTSLLLTGDAESRAEELMLSAEKDLLKADVLKLGHHGSSTSSSKAFLEAVQPKAVVISVGKNNDYGHPHKETLQRLKSIGTEIYRTDKLGTVRMLFIGSEVRLLSSSK